MNVERKRELRQRLCAAVSQNPNLADCNNLNNVLDSVHDEFRIYAQTTNSNAPVNCDSDDREQDEESNITPLMVACDKSHEASLIYLRNKIDALQPSELNYLVQLWGHPMETSSIAEGGNSAAHHALAAGFAFGLDIIEYFCGRCVEGHDTTNRDQTYLSLISQSNANGDTPVMMACAFGRIAALKHVLERCIKLSINEMHLKDTKLEENTVEKSWLTVQNVFSMQNEDGCSALNLSCGYGHINTVQLIGCPLSVQISWVDRVLNVDILRDTTINDNNSDNKSLKTNTHNFILEPLAKASYKDIKFCESSLQNLDAELKFMKQQHNRVDTHHLEEFTERRRKICECKEVLDKEMSRIATGAIDDLISVDNPCAATTKQNVSKKKKKKKRQKGNNAATIKTTTGEISSSRNDNNEIASTSEWKVVNEGDNHPASCLVSESPFVTLQDGRVVSRTSQPGDSETNHLDEKYDATTDTPLSLQSVNEVAINSQTHKFNIEAKMESLCLDPSMLLLSAHGMAMEMSPCQLETVQAILMHQLSAAQEAQAIQKRLLSERKDG